MKFANLAAAAALAVAGLGAPALAQNAAVTAGAAVFGSDGNPVGTVEKVEGGNAVVNTGAASAALPVDKFGKGDKGLTIGFTKAQFEEAVNGAAQKSAQQSAAALAAALVTGADVYSSDGQLIGQIKTLGDDGSIVITAGAGDFTANKEQVAMSADKLTFLATKAAVDAALAKPAEG